jgi:hypothetical protein
MKTIGMYRSAWAAPFGFDDEEVYRKCAPDARESRNHSAYFEVRRN